MRLTENGATPVYYSKIAKVMGVSDWSSYDMMLSLVEEGLAIKVFENTKGPGRTRLLINITDSGLMKVSKMDMDDSLSRCIITMNYAMSLAHIHIPESLTTFQPSINSGKKWIIPFASNLFDRLNSELGNHGVPICVVGNLSKIREVFSNSVKKLSKTQLVSLGTIITTSLLMFGKPGKII